MVLPLTVRFLFAALVLFCPLCCFGETVLLDFSSPTCGPCQQMRPVVHRLATDGIPVREIDITRQPQLAAQYRVTQVPTFIVAIDGRPVEQTVGYTSYEQLHRMVRRYLPAPSPRNSVIPIGQSPDTDRTFANADLSRPQTGRIVSLQDPTPRTPRPKAVANPFGNAPPRPSTATSGSPNSHHQSLLAATVKITVDDPQGKSVGTGTIVDARGGEALVLTCGHLFRTSAGKGPITITTFQANASSATPGPSYAGSLIDYDLERDLALISLRPTSPVQAVEIASNDAQPLAPNVPVTSVGCNNGQNPTAIDSLVTSIDRYEGPSNVEVAGAPVEGRSGGGLFNAQGQLVGVCFAADPQGNEGLYASLRSIYAKLDSLQLSMIYQQGPAGPNVVQASASAPAQQAPSIVPAQSVTSIRGQEPESPSIAASPKFPITQQAPTNAVALPPAEQAALEEIQRRGINSEVICIIRPQDPSAKSEVITLNNVSPAFVGALANPASGITPSNPRDVSSPASLLR